MTQEVEPLTWQKRTNIEEHQQFFAKINEIIDNLAPTVDEAEAAVETANAASAAASAAATQAQTAASTVAGYNTRLLAVEADVGTNAVDIAALQGRMTTAESDISDAKGDITSLDGRLTTTEGSIISFGTRMTSAENDIDALETADGNNVKIAGTHAIGNYAMLLTGNQTIYGTKRFEGRILERVSYVKNTTNATSAIPIFRMSDRMKTDQYMKAVLLITGRTTPTTLTEVVWNSGAVSKTDIVGTQTNPFSIMSDTEGDYWLCITIGANNTVSAFTLCCLRNAGFDESVYPLITTETPDMTGWTVVSQ